MAIGTGITGKGGTTGGAKDICWPYKSKGSSYVGLAKGDGVAIGFGEGTKKARMATAARLGRMVNQTLMAQLVNDELKRMGSRKTISQSGWSDYEAERSEPALVTIRAAAHVSGLSEAEIAFGPPRDEEAHARARRVAEPSPDVELASPDRLRPLTTEELDRADRVAAAERAAAQPKRAAGGGRKGGGRSRP